MIAQLLEGVFGGLIIAASYIYFNSDLDNKKKIREFDNEEADSDEWYDKPTYTTSFVITVIILVCVVIFYDLRW